MTGSARIGEGGRINFHGRVKLGLVVGGTGMAWQYRRVLKDELVSAALGCSF
jgi:hypothetical protein